MKSFRELNLVQYRSDLKQGAPFKAHQDKRTLSKSFRFNQHEINLFIKAHNYRKYKNGMALAHEEKLPTVTAAVRDAIIHQLENMLNGRPLVKPQQDLGYLYTHNEKNADSALVGDMKAFCDGLQEVGDVSALFEGLPDELVLFEGSEHEN